MLISLPRTSISAPPNAFSMRRSNSSRSPRRSTMRWLPGTSILICVGDTAAFTSQATRGGCPFGYLPGRPVHRPPPDEVHVQVGDGVLGVLPDVEHQPVAPLGQALLAGHGLGRLH